MRFREFTENDIEACVRLLQVGHDPEFTRERFEWLHLLNPLAPSRIALALEGDRVVGFYGVIKKILLVNGNRYVAGRDIDPVVHPDYRSQGIFGRLLEFGLTNFREVDVLFNFANKLSAPGFVKKGWIPIIPLQDYVFQTGVAKIGLQSCVAYTMSWSRLFFGEGGRNNRFVEEVHPSQFNEYENLFKASADAAIQVERSRHYMEWRYLKKPGGTYRYFVETFQGHPERLYILTINEQRREVTLCDVVQTHSSPPLFVSLFSYFRKLGRGYKIKVWGSFHKKNLGQFIRNPFSGDGAGSVLFRKMPANSSVLELSKFDKMMITHGDLEGI